MSLIVYCSQTNVESILSAYGVNTRTDDGETGSTDATKVADAIAQATTQVNQRLFQMYAPSVIQSSTWAVWCTATIAAVLLCRRRGMPVPPHLDQEAKDYFEVLKNIKNGIEPLMTDTGLATPLADQTLVMSNIAVDGRFRYGKLRYVPPTSVGERNNSGPTLNNPVLGMFWP